MQEEYKTVYRGGEGEIVEKKSRFIATVRPVHSEEEVLAFIEEVKKKYWDARHNCFAYVIGVTNPTLRCSDDGEPAGTAGKPMLDVLTGEGLHDTAVVVTRYFGRTACAQSPSLWRCIGRMDSCIFCFRFKMATERMRPPCRFRCRAKHLRRFLENLRCPIR